MLIVKVYCLDSEALERRVAGFVNPFFVTADRGVTLGITKISEFGAEENFGASSTVFEPFSDEFLVGVGTVDVRTVNRSVCRRIERTI